jgi:hypothetical protein
MSVIAEASADVELVYSTEAEDVYPNVRRITRYILDIYTNPIIIGCISSSSYCTF